MTTLWISFSERDSGKWLGVVILDVAGVTVRENTSRFEWLKIAQAMRQHNIAPGLGRTRYFVMWVLVATKLAAPGWLVEWLCTPKKISMHVNDVTLSPHIAAMAPHKNKLIMDEALLMSLGSSGRAKR